jgi:hypothetical protein
MHPYFTSRMAEQHRQELMVAADSRRSARRVNARPSRGQRFWAVLRRRREAVWLVQPCGAVIKESICGDAETANQFLLPR